MRYAGFWVRFWAYMIDTLILVALVLVVGLIIYVASGIPVEEKKFGLFDLVALLFGWLYFAFFESGRWQATPGKRLMGLRVTNITGDRISFARASGRTFAKYISAITLGIGYIMVGLTDKKQGLHDIMATTLVLRGKAGDLDSAFASKHNRPESQADTVVISSSFGQAPRWVMAGFDANGLVVRLTFSEDNPLLEKAGLIIGRDSKSCDLHISDSSVSRTHARLYTNQGRLWIEDLKSANGTQVNDQRVTSGSAVTFPQHGNITMGAVVLSVSKF